MKDTHQVILKRASKINVFQKNKELINQIGGMINYLVKYNKYKYL